MVRCATLIFGCNSEKSKTGPELQNINHTTKETNTFTNHLKPFKPELLTIGLLMYDGVLQSEDVATSDVFAKPTEDGKQLFKLVITSETENPITTEEGMRFVPGYTFENSPKPEALFVSGVCHMYTQVHTAKLWIL